MIIQPYKTTVFEEGADLFTFITHHVQPLQEGDVLVITSKIVALAEGRTVPSGSPEDKERLIREESQLAISTPHVWLTLKDGMWMASAGIDESNALDKWILLPKDSFASAEVLWIRLRHYYHIKKLGILITDSRTTLLRAGVTGVALGYAGFRGLRNYRGTEDLFGRPFRFSQTNVADSLATAAVLLMGEGNEQQPLAVIQTSRVEFCEHMNRHELEIDLKDDMYTPLFHRLSATPNSEDFL